jgi:hypothetical protein
MLNKGGVMSHRLDFLVHLAALISFGLSVSLWFLGYREEGLFVGIWVPSIFGYATYLKMSGAKS